MSEGNFPEGQSPSATIQIDPEVQKRLKISDDDIQNYNAEKRKEEEFLREMQNNGREFFRNWPGEKKIQVREFIIPIHTPLVYDAPEETITFLQQNRESIPEDERQIVEKGLKSFIAGMGNEALDTFFLNKGSFTSPHSRRLYWKTAINAFDIVTEGGIGADESIQTKLGGVIDSPKERVEMAEYIMEKINRRKESTQQVPNSHIIPPEQRTPLEYAADKPERVVVGGQEEHPADLRPAPRQDGEPQV